MPGHRIVVTAALACLLALSGCNNTPLDTSGPFVAVGFFDTIRIVEKADGHTITVDSAYVDFVGTDATSGLHVDLNGTNLALVMAANGQSRYTSAVQFAPGEILTLTVSDTRRSYENSAAVPAVQPVFATPNPDSVYNRLDSLLISWSDANNDPMQILVSEDLGNGAVGDTLWIEVADASTGGISVPPSVWNNRDDTSAIISLWQAYVVDGEGFSGGLFMRTGVITIGRARVSAPSGTEL